MTISPDSQASPGLAAPVPRREGRELLLEWVFRPACDVLVPVLARLRVSPPAVVVANALVGFVAALAVAEDALVTGALLLQLKTLLDNCDGQLARVTGRVTLAGRYLDTLADLLVNAALFVALAHVTGQWLLSLAGFVALTLVLTVDFNLSELARESTGVPVTTPQAPVQSAERVLDAVYRCFYGPQDRLVRRISDRRFALAARGAPEADRYELRPLYYDRVTLGALANLGLTTQLAILGVCLVVGRPAAYPWFAVASLLVLLPVQARREWRVRRMARA